MSKFNVKLAIKSAHKHADRRAAQTATWIPELDADFFWLVGSPTPGEGGPVLTDVLSAKVSDDFENIAPKVYAACKYALEENVDYLCVLDDDTYLRPDRLLKSGFWKGDYIGFMRTSGLDYNRGIPYAQGSCYWMSARSMEEVVLSPEIVNQNGIIDDGAVGQALVSHVPFTHDYRYEPGPVPDRQPRPDNDVISTHKCLPRVMYQVHEQWRKRG